MNNLSWFLYFADTLPRIGSLAFFIAVIFGLLSIVYAMASWFAEDGDKDARDFVTIPLAKHSLLVFVLACAIAVFTPSKETIYLVAGSEAGEFVVNTPEAKAILSDIQEVIQLQIESLKPK